VDLVAGNLNGVVSVAGLPVNSSRPGTFIVTYSACDPAGNCATTQRRVIVVPQVGLRVFLLGPAQVWFACIGFLYLSTRL
jgi:hypothetical protein